MKSPHLLKTAIFVSLFLTVVSAATAQTIIVNATSNIFGAGDSPNSPTWITNNDSDGIYPVYVSISSPLVTVSATGTISISSALTNVAPDGIKQSSISGFDSYKGISGFTFDYAAALFAVFIGSKKPDSSSTFHLEGMEDNLVFSPELEQIFFIGDGLTGNDAVQTIVVPDGATRLYFGFTDSSSGGIGLSPSNYDDNTGSLSVTVTAIPEPAFYTAILSIVSLLGMFLLRKRPRLV